MSQTHLYKEDLLPSDEDVSFFETNGYWLGGKVADEARLEALREAMERVYAGDCETGRAPWQGGWRPGGDPSGIRKTDNSHWSNLALCSLAADPVIGAMAARLMKTREVRLWHDQLLYKPGTASGDAGGAGNVGWHQDRNYWQCTTPNLVTAWVAFDDVDFDNGCMQVVPGSNRWGEVEGDFFASDLKALEKDIVARTGKPFQTVPCILKAGEVSFHHCLTLHGSGPNTTNHPRRSLVVHLMPEDARYVAGTTGDGHMNVELLKERGGKDGDRFQGDPWPVLYTAPTPEG